MKEKLCAHQETISILSQQKKAQIKLYKTRKDQELYKVIALEKKFKVLDNIVYKTGQSVQTMNMLNNKCRTSFAKPEFLKKVQRANPRLYDIGCYNDNLALMLAPESDEVNRLEKESRSMLSDLIRPFDYEKLNNLYDLFVPQREKSSEQRYFSETSRLSHKPVNNGNSKESFNKQTTLLEKRMDESIPWDQKYPFIKNTVEANFSQAIRRINAGLEQFLVCLNEEIVADLRYFNSLELDVDSLRSQLETQKTKFLNEIDRLSREYYYADHMNAILGVYTKLNEDLKAQLQDKGIVISELKKLIEMLKGKSVNTKFEKSSVIQQPNAFKSQRPSILGKPTTFSISLERNDFSKSKLVTQNNVSNDFSKPVTAHTLPPNKKSIIKNMTVLAPGMYKLHTKLTQTRTSQLPQDSRKTNKRVSFSTGVIPTTSVSRPQLKSNPMEDRFMRNNSQGKQQDVEDHHRNVKFSKNKMTKIPIAVPVSTKEPKCAVKQSVAKPIRKTVNSESNQKPINITRKLYERVRKACSWWYPNFTPSGYKWKFKSGKENVNPNLIEIVLFIVDSGCSKHMTGNLKLLINFVEKFLGTVKFENEQIAPILGYGDLVQGAITIKRVYYVDGLNHNLFFVGQFYDADLEVSFWKSTCYIRNLKGNDLLTAWLWHRHLSHLNFDTINLLSKNDIVACPKRTSSSYKNFQTDKGTEFLNQTLHAYFAAEGILHQIEGENLDKMKEKGDACIFVGYSTQSRAYRVFNKRTRVIVETIHVNFDELPHMASDHVSSDPAPECQRMALEHGSLSPGLQCQENVTQADKTSSAVSTADAPNQRQQHTTPLNTHTTPTPTCQVLTHAPTITSPENMEQAEMVEEYDQVENDEFINIFCTPVQDKEETSSRHVDFSNMHTFYQHHPSEHHWTKDRPLEQVIGNPSQSLRTRR
nr:hypothetical protein [Tanacetum cinerariifolium]